MQLTILILTALVATVMGFRNVPVRMGFHSLPVLRMSDEERDEPTFVPDEQESGFFDANRRVRLGRSRDQDGKSNVWSIEPRMEVMEAEDGEEESATSANLKVAGLAIGTAVACLPVFLLLSKLLPDPDQF